MTGMFFVMFVYNTYLQMRNLSDRNAKRPNLLLLVFSILLFMLITCVSCPFMGLPPPKPFAYVFVTPAMGRRSFSAIRGRCKVGGSD